MTALGDRGEFQSVAGRRFEIQLLGVNAMEKMTDEQRKEKKRISQAAWRAANKEHIKAYNAAYVANASGGEKRDRSEYYRSWYERHRSERIAAAKKWMILNKERYQELRAIWRSKNMQRHAQSAAAWRAKNPEAARLIKQRRRARMRNAQGTLSAGLINRLFVLQKGKCPCCRQPLGDDFHLDHKMPLALGGSNTDDNMQLMRARCNRQKYTKHPVDFMQSRGFLL